MPSTCDELIDLTVQLDHRLQERKGDKQKSDSRFLFTRTKPSAEERPPSVEGVEPMQFRPGPQNGKADALSRPSFGTDDTQLSSEEPPVILQNASFESVNPVVVTADDFLEEIKTHYQQMDVSAYEKGEIWVDIARAVRSEGGPRRRLRNIKKRWQDIRCWSRRIARVQLKLEAPRRHGGSRQLTPNMLRVLEVVFPDLHRQLQEGQQHEGASSSESGGDRGADQAEGHTDSATCWEVSEGGSGTEWEESLQAARHVTDTSYHADESETDSQEGGEYAAMVTHTSLAALPSSSPISNLPLLGVPRVRASPRVSFVPGTAAPAPVSPAALSAETVDLLRQIAVGQASMLSVLHGHTQLITQVVSFMEGMSSAMSDLRRSVAAIESTLTAAMYTQQHLSPPHPSEPSTSASHIPTQHTRTRHRSDTPSAHTQHKKLKAPRTQSQGQVGTPTGRGETPHTHIHTPSRTDSQPCTSTPNVSPGSGGSFSALAEVCSQVFESTFGDAPTSVDESTTPAPTPPVLPSPVHAVPEDSTDGAPIVSTAD
ncbi:uncharacterized protein LOC144828144 [Lissotriton helveticus]